METTHRQQKTILCADVSEYSALMETNEQRTHTNLCARLSLIASLIHHFDGVTLRTEGDSVLASFDTATNALQCAIKIQAVSAEQNKSLGLREQLWLRIGINCGNAIIDNGEVFGNCVNIAARLEAIANPGGIVISESVFKLVENTLPYEYIYLGSHRLKNIINPIKLYKVPLETEKTNKHTSSFFTHITRSYFKPSFVIAASFSAAFLVTIYFSSDQFRNTKYFSEYASSLNSSISADTNTQVLLSNSPKFNLNPRTMLQANRNGANLFNQALKLDFNNDDYELDTNKFIIVEELPNSTETILTNVLWNY